MDKLALAALVKMAVEMTPEIRLLLSAKALELVEADRQDFQDRKNRRFTGAEESILEPVYQEAVARVVRREVNDLRGAARRMLAKGQEKEFERWCDHFYSVEQPDFVRRTFLPVLEAQERWNGLDGSAALESVMQNYLSEQRRKISGLSAEALEGESETWLRVYPKDLTNEIMQVILEEA